MTPTVLGTKKRCCGWQARVGHSVGEEMPCRVLTWVRSLALGAGEGGVRVGRRAPGCQGDVSRSSPWYFPQHRAQTWHGMPSVHSIKEGH